MLQAAKYRYGIHFSVRVRLRFDKRSNFKVARIIDIISSAKLKLLYCTQKQDRFETCFKTAEFVLIFSRSLGLTVSVVAWVGDFHLDFSGLGFETVSSASLFPFSLLPL